MAADERAFEEGPVDMEEPVSYQGPGIPSPPAPAGHEAVVELLVAARDDLRAEALPVEGLPRFDLLPVEAVVLEEEDGLPGEAGGVLRLHRAGARDGLEGPAAG